MLSTANRVIYHASFRLRRWLEHATFDRSVGIRRYFIGKTVKLTANNLIAETRPNVRLFNGILRHRVPRIQ